MPRWNSLTEICANINDVFFSMSYFSTLCEKVSHYLTQSIYLTELPKNYVEEFRSSFVVLIKKCYKMMNCSAVF